jgi:protein TonB
MFEDSLMESQDRLSPPNRRWTTALSLTLQCSLAAATITLPLLHPEALPFHIDPPKIMLPLKPVPLPVSRAETSDTASSTRPASSTARAFTQPTLITPLSQATSEAPPATNLIGTGMGDPNGISNALVSSKSGSGTLVSIAPANPAPRGPLHVSTGVSTGLLLAPIVPVYPRIAVSARVEGVVKVEAIISKSGHIESAHAVSGPEMLREAALDAIRNARYTPYMLNGSPTEVETTITVNFKLSS